MNGEILRYITMKNTMIFRQNPSFASSKAQVREKEKITMVNSSKAVEDVKERFESVLAKKI